MLRVVFFSLSIALILSILATTCSLIPALPLAHLRRALFIFIYASMYRCVEAILDPVPIEVSWSGGGLSLRDDPNVTTQCSSAKVPAHVYTINVVGSCRQLGASSTI